MESSSSFHATRARPRRRTHVVALVAGVALAAGACTSGSSSDAEGTTATISSSPVTAAGQGDIAGTFDIGGRKVYIQCTGQGSPTVILISGGGIAADLWDSPLGEQPTVYPTIAKTTRVCAYDRPGTTRALAEGGISRSDPVPQPVTPSMSAADLHALLDAAGQTGPFVLAAHSYGGLVARYFAHEYPDEVAGMVLVDSFSPELREAMPDLWPSWIDWNTTPAAVIEDYPDYERVDFDKALDEIVANRSISPMPLVVLTADQPYRRRRIPTCRPTQHGHTRSTGRIPASGGPAGARRRAHHQDRQRARHHAREPRARLRRHPRRRCGGARRPHQHAVKSA